MVLLHLLHRLTQDHRWQLAVAHFNHRLRGDASDADAALTRATAEKLGLTCFEESWRHEQDPELARHGPEMAARLARHQFLARAAARAGSRVVALAHHADDQTELFFLRLFRGSGGDGLAGMAWANPSPVNPDLLLVRPLLDLTRAALRDYAARHRIAFREDASNANPEHARNRIRHQLLPQLTHDFSPALATTIRRSMEIIGTDAEFTRQCAEKWLASHRRTRFKNLHPAIQRQVTRLQLRALGIEPDFALIEHLRHQTDHPISVRPDLVVWRIPDGTLAAGPPTPPAFLAAAATFELSGIQGELHFGRLHLHWEFAPQPGARLPTPSERNCECFDAAKIGRRITLRHWQAGDRFHPIGMPRPVKLQDLFAAARVPRAERHRRVVAVAENGAPFWVEGLRMSEQFKLDNQTRRRFKWTWVRP